jgi:hypothetical protein
VVEFTATLSGSRSRIDKIDSVYQSGDISKPPDAIKNSISVFDGNTNRSFNQIEGDEVKQGIIVSDNVNDSMLRVGLWVMGFDLCFPGVAENPNVTLKETQDPNIYIIDDLNPKTRWIYRMTIDAGRQYNVIKFETIKADGSYDYVIDYTHKKHPNGTWFMAGWEKRRYFIRAKKGNPAVTWAAKVEEVDFDIDVPEETFRLEYPPGTSISDSDTGVSYVVGAPEPPALDMGPAAKPEDISDKGPSGEIGPAQERGAEKRKSGGHTLAQTIAENNYLLWLVVIAVVVIILFAMAYRFRRKKSESK